MHKIKIVGDMSTTEMTKLKKYNDLKKCKIIKKKQRCSKIQAKQHKKGKIAYKDFLIAKRT